MSRDPLIRRLEVSCSRQRRSFPRSSRSRVRSGISLYDQPGGHPGHTQDSQPVRHSTRRRLWPSSTDGLRLAAVVTACSVLILTGLLVQLQSPPVPPLELVEQPSASLETEIASTGDAASSESLLAAQRDNPARHVAKDTSRLWNHLPGEAALRQTAERDEASGGRLAFRPRRDVQADYPPAGAVERQPRDNRIPVTHPEATLDTAPAHHQPQPQISGLRRRLLSAPDPNLPRRPVPYENPDPRLASPVRRDGLVGPIPAVVRPETAILPKDGNRRPAEPVEEVPSPDGTETPENRDPSAADPGSPAEPLAPQTSESRSLLPGRQFHPARVSRQPASEATGTGRPGPLTADSIPDSDSLPASIFRVTDRQTAGQPPQPDAAATPQDGASGTSPRAARQSEREQLRRHVLARLKSAREAIARGELDLARAIVEDTAAVKVTYGLFDDRPDLVLTELDHLQNSPTAARPNIPSLERLPQPAASGPALQAIPPQQPERTVTPTSPNSIDLQRMQRQSMGTLLQAPVGSTEGPALPVPVPAAARPLRTPGTPVVLSPPRNTVPEEQRNPGSGSQAARLRPAPVSRATQVPVEGADLLSSDDRPPVLSPAPARPAEPQEFQLSFEFDNAPWGTVLNQLAEATGLQLQMPVTPPGGLTYHNPKKYSQAEVIRILDSILLRGGFRLYTAGNMLVVQPVATDRQP